MSDHNNQPEQQNDNLSREGAFRQMVERQKDLIWHICSDYSLSAAWEVSDAFQEALLVLWRDFNQFTGTSSERTWVYRVTTNCMLMIKRSIRNQPQPDSETIPEEAAPDNEGHDTLMQLIELLPETDATIVRAHLDGFDHSETAHMLGMTTAAVAMRLSRAKKTLRKQYDKLMSNN